MKATAIKTPLVELNDNLHQVIARSIKFLPEKSVLVISSKIISYCQGRWVKKTAESDEEEKERKHDLVRKEADRYLEPHTSRYDLMVTIKDQTVTVNAGIDESNAAGGYILWPENLQETVNDVWHFLRQHFNLKVVGVVVSDSRTTPLRWGVVGTALVHCGFKALHNYIGDKDLFGREMTMEQVSVSESMAAAAVLEMGEVAERTPLCIVENVRLIEFQDRTPTEKELEDLEISLEDDVYAPFLTQAEWQS